MFNRSVIFVVITLFSLNILFAQKKTKKSEIDLTTFAEKTNFQETPRYKETIEYIKKLEESSEWVKYISFGKSSEDRDLPLIIVSKDKSFTLEARKKSNKMLVMVQCAIHAGEIDGKDAMLMLVRDIAVNKKYENLLSNVDLMVIPIFNVDGHERVSTYNRINQNGPKEMGWRVTSKNLNLNRDYLKADAIEMKYWLSLFNNWVPDFFIDCHVTDGADFPYSITYEVETNDNISRELADWTKEKFLPYVLTNFEKTNHLIAPYTNFNDEYDIKKGISLGVMSPKLSTGYAAIQNRQGFLIETHSYKDYKTRVDANYQIVRVILEYINKDHKALKEANTRADKECETMYYKGEDFPLTFTLTDSNTALKFKSYKLNKDFSNISNSYTRSYTKEEEEHIIPFYNISKPKASVRPPFAYFIPKEWSELIDILLLHGVKIGKTMDEGSFMVEQYTILNPSWRERPYEGRHQLSFNVEKKSFKTAIPIGTYLVPVNQKASKVIMYLLEPESGESFLNWGFMDAIFEQKEYGEPYVLEKLAAKMLTEDPKLKDEFENKLKTDSTFAKNSYERLNFFYKKSPYWDKNIGVYPILRSLERQKFTK